MPDCQGGRGDSSKILSALDNEDFSDFEENFIVRKCFLSAEAGGNLFIKILTEGECFHVQNNVHILCYTFVVTSLEFLHIT